MNESEQPHRLPPQARLYDRVVLGMPLPFIFLFLGTTIFFALQLKNFKMDASSDSVVLENDKDLRYYDDTRQVFGSDDYVVLTVTPPGDDIFTATVIETLQAMVAELEAIDTVQSVVSILSVPLFESTPKKLSIYQIGRGYKSLTDEGVLLDMAREEFITSPLYQDYLISTDGRTTAVQVNFESNVLLTELENQRYALREKEQDGSITNEEKAELGRVEVDYAARHAELSEARKTHIEKIREIRDHYELNNDGLGKMRLGGVPMIMVDIINYVERDIRTFLVAVFAFVVLMMSLIFRKPKWIILPALSCGITVTIMMGYLGFMDWRTTIVTSNFSSVLLIQTMAMAIHVVVHFQEAHSRWPELSNRELTLRTVRHVAVPCFFTAFTTIVGFTSLIVSGIPPVIDFGKMMAMGLTLAYLVCFIFFPAALLFFPKGKVPAKSIGELSGSPFAVFASITEKYRITIALSSVAIILLCILGITRLTVENRFIDYFKKSSEIYMGMTEIDNRLGGTTPLEVIIDGEGKDYWLEEENLQQLREIHDWLDAQEETGKVISPVTMTRILDKVNNDKQVSVRTIKLLRTFIPDEIARAVLTPYVTPDFDTARIAMRVRESDKSLQRKDLMARLNGYFENESGLAPGTWHITGVFVLYNNMLQSLFSSQIMTIGVVVLAIWFVFVILFRSFAWATIAIIPNAMPVVVVLGTLGWANIPLDMMTIMIAAVTFGISVDDTIHYIHRFRVEFPRDRDYVATMYRCHNSIGRAIVFTSLTIVVGFSILCLSNFLPTIYFGIFTGLAMIVALLAAVLLLPLIIISWKPMGPEAEGASVES